MAKTNKKAGPIRKIRLNVDRQHLRYVTAEYIEESLDRRIPKGRLAAPELKGKPKRGIWYKVPVEEGMSGDGSGYHVYLKRGHSKNLCIFFSGGGMAWDEYTAARPVTYARIAAGLPHFYWDNLRPVTQLMNINLGITETGSRRNPFDDWNFLVITYATGDLHIGDHDFIYHTESGAEKTLHFHGFRNYEESMKIIHHWMESPAKLLIAGNSAGAFAVPALAGDIIDHYYPDCPDITLFSDSGQCVFDKWRHTVENVWRAPMDIVRPVHSDNVTVDWYRHLYEKYGSRLRYLYASSVHDFLLSAYYNETVSGNFESTPEMQFLFGVQLKVMVRELKEITPDFGFFIYDWKNVLYTKGGTIHTAVREPYFYLKNKDGISMADWLSDAVNGNVKNIGLNLLEDELI
jgi:hypothetical protein